jgi:TM2 domain-containing membrane protein YozV
MALVFCRECGKQMSDTAFACPNCGATTGVNKSRSAAVVLALLLGGLGMHKFYLNRPGAGAMYVLFCWTFIPAVVSLIEGVNYLCMSDTTFRQRYCIAR